MVDYTSKYQQPLIKGLILDMDGVLWRGPEPIGDLPSIFKRIDSLRWKVVFATNNATRTIDQYVEIIRSFGVHVLPEQIVTSGIATGLYLKKHYDGGGEIYVIGEGGLTRTLESFDFVHGEKAPKAVVIGLDRNLTYEKMNIASKFIRAGFEFIGTNPDPTLPTPDGFVPGTGAILAAIEAATGVIPTIIGKPYPELFRISVDRLGTIPEETLVVGDRIETDIAGGISAGCLTALVLSGVTAAEAAQESPYKPTFIASDFTALLDKIS